MSLSSETALLHPRNCCILCASIVCCRLVTNLDEKSFSKKLPLKISFRISDTVSCCLYYQTFFFFFCHINNQYFLNETSFPLSEDLASQFHKSEWRLHERAAKSVVAEPEWEEQGKKSPVIPLRTVQDGNTHCSSCHTR